MKVSLITAKYSELEWVLDERLRRLVFAAEAKVLGRGGISTVANSTGISRRALHQGLKELSEKSSTHHNDIRIRKPGAGRKTILENVPTLQRDLESLVEPTTRGDPESSLRSMPFGNS